MLVDGDYLMWAVRTMLGRAPAPSERINFGQLQQAVSTAYDGGPRRVTVHYFQRNWANSYSFFWTLEHRFGFTMRLFDPDKGLIPVKEAIAATLTSLEEVDCDVVMAGGDSQFTDHLRKLVRQRVIGGIQRNVGVVYLRGWCEIAAPDDPEFDMFDLISDIHAAPEELYAVQQNAAPPPPKPTASRFSSQRPQTEVQPPRIVSVPPGIGAEPLAERRAAAPAAESTLRSPLREPNIASPDQADDADLAPERESGTVVSATANRRPLLVLIDHENIDWSLGDLIGADNLNQSTRPQWPLLKRFLDEGAGDGPLLVYSYLQHNEANTGFARYLDKELGFRPELLVPEPDAIQANQRRPVVDEAIYDMLAALKTRHCDVVIVSNDGGYLPHLEELRVNGFDRHRRFSVIGFSDEMAAVYAKADWINVIDLERDVGAFTYALPRRYAPTRLADYDPAASLGDFGLELSNADAQDEATDDREESGNNVVRLDRVLREALDQTNDD